MHLGIPQILILAIYFMNIGISLAKNGERKDDGTYSVWSTLIATAISLGILAWGGFFS